jgi:hypothetical protein
MTSVKDRFLTLKKEIYGSISFGNENATKIIGKGTLKLESKDAMEKNVYREQKDSKENSTSCY